MPAMRQSMAIQMQSINSIFAWHNFLLGKEITARNMINYAAKCEKNCGPKQIWPEEAGRQGDRQGEGGYMGCICLCELWIVYCGLRIGGAVHVSNSFMPMAL